MNLIPVLILGLIISLTAQISHAGETTLAVAEQELQQGNYDRALSRLADFLENADEPQQIAIALSLKGNAHRLSGNLDEAIASFSEAQALFPSARTAANLSRALLDRSLHIAKLAQSVSRADLSLHDIYAVDAKRDRDRAIVLARQAVSMSSEGLESLQARANLASICPSCEQGEEAAAIADAIPPSTDKVYSLVELGFLDSALEAARTVGDRRALSWVAGAIGQRHQQAGRCQEAIPWLERAAAFAPVEEQFRFLQSSGDCWLESGDRDRAKADYQQAINSLEYAKNGILSRKISVDFNREIDPIYRQYITLLFEDGENDAALTAFKQLQTLELEIYLGVECNIRREERSHFLYTILLDDAVYLVLSQSGETYVERIPIAEAALEELVSAFVRNAQLLAHDEFRIPSRKLYQLLIAPLSHRIPEGEMLRILPDRSLRSIPWAALLDERDRFLIEHHPIRLSIVAEIEEPPRFSLSRSERVAIFGNAERLPFVTEEVKAIGELLPSARFFGEKFSLENLARALESRRYGIVHIATHASFFGTLEDSYIEGYERISMRDFARIVGDFSPSLIVFSACETAMGDEQTVLGFAGLAIQGKSDRVIASLIPVDDTTTATLMQQFYYHYSKGETPTKALQLAQVEILQGPTYHPYHWAGFLIFEGL